MRGFLTGLILIPSLDQAVKVVLRDRLGGGSISLGPVGRIRVVQARIWMARLAGAQSLTAIWAVWISAAAALALASTLVPPVGWPAGAILGASLSHAVETSIRGSVSDYVCLRRWPAFNIADVALTVGGCGLVVELSLAIYATWS